MPGSHHSRHTIEHHAEVVTLPQLGFAGRNPHPDGQSEIALSGNRRVQRRSRRRECRAHTVAGVLEQPAPMRLDRLTQHLVVGGKRGPHATASASHRRVEPSTSVNRNVTTPEGAAAGSADTYAESHNRGRLTSYIGGQGSVTGDTSKFCSSPDRFPHCDTQSVTRHWTGVRGCTGPQPLTTAHATP